MAILEGILAGAGGSIIGKLFGIGEKYMSHRHELKLQKLQMEARQSETENELAIAREENAASMREASYEHAMSGGQASQRVIDTLRLVRPVLTVGLMVIVTVLWFTLAQNDAGLRQEIVDGVLFMASTALAWWFGDRAPQSKRLPWQ